MATYWTPNDFLFMSVRRFLKTCNDVTDMEEFAQCLKFASEPDILQNAMLKALIGEFRDEFTNMTDAPQAQILDKLMGVLHNTSMVDFTSVPNEIILSVSVQQLIF